MMCYGLASVPPSKLGLTQLNFGSAQCRPDEISAKWAGTGNWPRRRMNHNVSHRSACLLHAGIGFTHTHIKSCILKDPHQAVGECVNWQLRRCADEISLRWRAGSGRQAADVRH